MRRFGLAEAADIVASRLDGHERGLLDGRAIDLLAPVHHLPSGKAMILEHRLDRLQIELRRQVHDGEIFLVEFLMLAGRYRSRP